jgi:hypothetical protein
MIIRHGEKPGNPANDGDGGPDLSILGSARAAALPSLFTPSPASMPLTPPTPMQPSCCVAPDKDHFTGKYVSSGLPALPPLFPVPNFLFATQQSGTKDDPGSNRPYETITPLSEALQLSINNNYSNNDYADVVTEILTTNPAKYANQVVLICWHHGNIPKLVEAFGVPASELPFPKWPATVFDLVCQITWSGTQAGLTIGYQQLLFGDSAKP